MATVGDVLVRFGGDAGPFQRSLGTMNIAFGTFVGNLLTKAAALSVQLPVKIVGSLGGMVQGVADLGDSLLSMKKKTDISVETLSALRLATKLNETDMGSLAVGIRMMQRNLANADEESKAMQKTLAELGFTQSDLDIFMKDGEQFLSRFSVALTGISDPAKRTQVAMEVMGRSGTELIPLMMDLADRGIGGVKREALALGGIFSEKLARASDAFNDNLTKLGFAFEGLKVRFLGPLVAAFATLFEQLLRSDMFANLMKQIDVLAKSGAIEEWAKRTALGIANFMISLPRTVAVAFRAIVDIGTFAFQDLLMAGSSFAAKMNVIFASIANIMVTIARGIEQSPFVGRLFPGLEAQAMKFADTVATEIGNVQVNLATMAAQVEPPQAFRNAEKVLMGVAEQAERFGKTMAGSFDLVKGQIEGATTSAHALTAPLRVQETIAGDIVKTSGGAVSIFDRATGSIVLMNRELALARQLIQDINANPLKPAG